jgi:hypothetical protein
VLRASLFGEAVHAVVVPETEPAGIRRALVDEGLDVPDVRTVPPSLEDVFIEKVPVPEHG